MSACLLACLSFQVQIHTHPCTCWVCDLSRVCRRTEKSMERVLGLNQSLVDSFARQQATPDPSSDSLGVQHAHTPPSPTKLTTGITLFHHCSLLSDKAMDLSLG